MTDSNNPNDDSRAVWMAQRGWDRRQGPPNTRTTQQWVVLVFFNLSLAAKHESVGFHFRWLSPDTETT